MTYMSGRRLRRDSVKRNRRRNIKDPIRKLRRLVDCMRYYADEIPFHKKFLINKDSFTFPTPINNERRLD